MYIKAGNGCWLTQVADIDFSKREFKKEVYAATFMQAAEWQEISDNDKISMEEENRFFNLDNLDFSYLKKIESLEITLPYKINEANLTNNEALEMQKYFPTWEQCWGKQVYAGFKFLYEGVLLEVVTPHTMSEDINPAAQPMTLNLVDGEDAPPVMYKIVEHEEVVPQEETTKDDKEINNSNNNLNK